MNPSHRPWDRPYRNHLISPSAQSQYMLGNNPLDPSTFVNSSSMPNPLKQVPGQNISTTSANNAPPPPPRTNVPNHGRTIVTNPSTAYDGSLGYGGYGRYGAMNRYGGLGGYGGYGGYNTYGGYGGYGGYGSYGGYGGMYGTYGNYGMGQGLPVNPNDPEGQFIRLAEESSRPAFQSIESLVQAFHSVSIMLDSTLTAVHTLFRAVLGMADNFGRLRSLLKQFFGSLALFRIFLWSYRKLLYLVGATKSNPNREEIWQNAAVELRSQVAQELQANKGSPRSAWPILLFLGIVLSGPYLILKFINSLNPSARRNKDENVLWNPMTQPGHLRIALYDYTATSEDELSFRAGQRIIVAPAALQPQGGWLLACTGNSAQVGLVPSNYLAKPRLPGQVRSIPNQAYQSTMPSTSMPSTSMPSTSMPSTSVDVSSVPLVETSQPAIPEQVQPEQLLQQPQSALQHSAQPQQQSAEQPQSAQQEQVPQLTDAPQTETSTLKE